MQRLLFHPIVRESISSINAFTILGASVPMDGESSLNSVKTGGGRRERSTAGVFFITLCSQSLLAGLLFSFINSKYSCTSMISSVVTGDCIFQKTWHFKEPLSSREEKNLAFWGKNPAVKGIEAVLHFNKAIHLSVFACLAHFLAI